MKRHVTMLLVALCLAGTASAQGLLPPVPDTLTTPRFRAPIGIKDLPRYYENAPWKTPDTDSQATYEKALENYKKALRQPTTPLPNKPEDCAMIFWVDTTATVPMPTLPPNPNVEPNMPILTPDMGCTPSSSLNRLPDSLFTPSLPLKQYPMLFPRK